MNGACQFRMSENNPNDLIGGGCACHETKGYDQHGPYAVFHSVEMASNQSPFLVVCAPCARAIAEQADGELLAIGRPPDPVIDGDAVEVEL